MYGTLIRKRGNVQTVKTMIKTHIIKGYLFHFIYIPIALTYSIIQNELYNVLITIFFLSLVFGGIAYSFNYFITSIGLRLLKFSKIMPFALPTCIGLLLYYPINKWIKLLDFGGNYAYTIFLVLSTIINIGTYLKYR